MQRCISNFSLPTEKNILRRSSNIYSSVGDISMSPTMLNHIRQPRICYMWRKMPLLGLSLSKRRLVAMQILQRLTYPCITIRSCTAIWILTLIYIRNSIKTTRNRMLDSWFIIEKVSFYSLSLKWKKKMFPKFRRASRCHLQGNHELVQSKRGKDFYLTLGKLTLLILEQCVCVCFFSVSIILRWFGATILRWFGAVAIFQKIRFQSATLLSVSFNRNVI